MLAFLLRFALSGTSSKATLPPGVRGVAGVAGVPLAADEEGDSVEAMGEPVGVPLSARPVGKNKKIDEHSSYGLSDIAIFGLLCLLQQEGGATAGKQWASLQACGIATT